MKKFIYIALLVLFISGCVNKVDIKGTITEIKYNDTIILKEDYDKVTKLLSNTFYNSDSKNLNDSLTIKTDKDIYFYKVSDEYVGYGNGVSSNDKLGSLLKNLEIKYNDTSFYDINYSKSYESKDNDVNVLLDKTSNYIVINFNKDIKNFKINELEFIDGKYQEVDLLYERNYIGGNQVVIRKSINYEKPDIKISFENSYGFKISIIPQYDGDGNVNFKTENKNA